MRILVAALLLLTALPAQAEWFRAETAHFTLSGDLPESKIRRYARELEALDNAMVQITGADHAPRRKLDILIVDSIATLQSLGGVDSLTGAYYFANAADEAAVVAQSDGGASPFYDMRDALYHEYSHFFLRTRMPGLHPRWFNEGFASFFESARMLGNGKMRIGAPPVSLILSLRTQKVPPFASIAGVGNPYALDGPARTGLYALGWLVTHYSYFGGIRKAEIERYLARARSGQPLGKQDALFVGGLAGFDADLQTYARAALPPPRDLDVPALGEADIAIRPLRPGEVGLVLRRVDDSDIGKGGGRVKLAQDTGRAYQVANALARLYPDDSALALYTAKLAFLAGEHTRAAQLIDPLAAARPDDPDLLALRGRVLVRVARAGRDASLSATLAQSRALLERALAIDPDSVDALVGMFENGIEATGSNRTAIAYLKHALEIQPDNFQLRARAVEHLLINGDRAGAIALLEPLANSPHAGPMREATIKLLAALKAPARRRR